MAVGPARCRQAAGRMAALLTLRNLVLIAALFAPCWIQSPMRPAQRNCLRPVRFGASPLDARRMMEANGGGWKRRTCPSAVGSPSADKAGGWREQVGKRVPRANLARLRCAVSL